MTRFEDPRSLREVRACTATGAHEYARAVLHISGGDVPPGALARIKALPGVRRAIARDHLAVLIEDEGYGYIGVNTLAWELAYHHAARNHPTFRSAQRAAAAPNG
jgi:hypothetical protein